jgi:hypothetical protein
MSELGQKPRIETYPRSEPQLSSPGSTGRPSIPEALVINREAAAYWITRSSRVMTASMGLRYGLRVPTYSPIGLLGLAVDQPRHTYTAVIARLDPPVFSVWP